MRHTDGSYLCMQRAMSKSVYPGFYEVTASGSALFGEDKIQCIKRELKEETGITRDAFEEIACRVFDENHYIFHTFACTVDCDKDSVKLQKGETEGYKWMNETEFIEFVNSDRIIDRQKRRYYDYFCKMGYTKKQPLLPFAKM